MPKDYPKKKGFSIRGFDAQQYMRTEAYTSAVDALYEQAIKEYIALAGKVSYDPNKVFSFADYPQTKLKAQQIVTDLSNNMRSVITTGSKESWLNACQKNDAFLNHLLDISKVPKALLDKWQDRNLDALSAFQSRKINGLGLSDRIWNYTGQLKEQMHLGIDIALGDGKSAQALSRDLRQYLVDPDKLFRRVRDKHGNLVLSKNAKAFNPGQGKYRSSYKNAMRLTRSEINMAYSSSDHLQMQKLDFVNGFEIKISNNHPVTDICDDLKGKYPKTFNWSAKWHPQCRCYRVNILMNRDEFNTDELNELKAAINGTEYNKLEASNLLYSVPQGFKDWIANNAERSKGWKSQPYFIRDNFNNGNIGGGLKNSIAASKFGNAKTIEEAAKILKDRFGIKDVSLDG